MPFVRTEQLDDLVTLNGFRLEINGVPIQAITNVGGIKRTTGTIEWVDGGTGNVEYFTDQKKVYGPLTLKYRIDPTKGDFDRLRQVVTESIGLGAKVDFTIVKYHFGVELFRIIVYKGMFHEESWSELDKNGSGSLDIDLTVACSFWELVRASNN